MASAYAHGSNDGQKGMGLIMLILVGTVPTAYALNHAVGTREVQTFAAVSTQVVGTLRIMSIRAASRRIPVLSSSASSHEEVRARLILALQQMVTDVRNEATSYGSLGKVPPDMQANVRNQMYLTSETFSAARKDRTRDERCR